MPDSLPVLIVNFSGFQYSILGPDKKDGNFKWGSVGNSKRRFRPVRIRESHADVKIQENERRRWLAFILRKIGLKHWEKRIERRLRMSSRGIEWAAWEKHGERKCLQDFFRPDSWNFECGFGNFRTWINLSKPASECLENFQQEFRNESIWNYLPMQCGESLDPDG